MTDQPMAPAAQTLAGIQLLASLTPADRQALERRCRWRQFAQGEQIIDRDTDSHEVYFIVRGSARVVNFALSGREVSFDDVGAGGCFGEMAAIDGAPRSASVVALNDTLTASLPASAFIELLKEHPDVALGMMKRLTAIIRNSTGRIMDLSTLGANNRVYAELLRLAVPAGPGKLPTIRPIPVHSDLAARVSTTRETVARALSDLVRKKVLRRDKGSLAILDLDRLQQMVHEFRE